MITFSLVLVVAAIICFALAAFNVQSRVWLMPIGLALWCLSTVLRV